MKKRRLSVSSVSRRAHPLSALVCSVGELFIRGDLKVKKEILAAIGSNLTLKDKKLFIEAKHPFLILEKTLSRIPVAQVRFEPEKFLANKGKRELVGSLRPTGLGGWDDDRTYANGKRLGWQTPVQEILQHVMACEIECPQLGMTLDKLVVTVSEYQKQAV